MIFVRRYFVLLLAIAALSFSASAQKSKRPVPKPTPKPFISADITAAKEKVSNQQSNVNRFIDVLGPIAQGIESLDAQNRTKRLSKAANDANEANKQKVIIALRNLKSGLSSLETDFRTKPALSRYLPQIQGISDLAAQSEDSMLAGKFVASKEPLRTVAQKLTDTMAVLPK